MSLVIKRSGTTRRSFFRDRLNTEQLQFVSAISGDAHVIENTAVAADQVTRGITIPAADTIDVRLPFAYFLGLKQIEVLLLDPSTGDLAEILRRADYPPVGPLIDTALDGAARTFDELSSRDVRIYNTAVGDVFWIGFSHTAAPATLREKVLIANQADNIGLELEGAGDGFVLRSPDNERHRVLVNNGGNISTERL